MIRFSRSSIRRKLNNIKNRNKEENGDITKNELAELVHEGNYLH